VKVGVVGRGKVGAGDVMEGVVGAGDVVGGVVGAGGVFVVAGGADCVVSVPMVPRSGAGEDVGGPEGVVVGGDSVPMVPESGAGEEVGGVGDVVAGGDAVPMVPESEAGAGSPGQPSPGTSTASMMWMMDSHVTISTTVTVALDPQSEAVTVTVSPVTPMVTVPSFRTGMLWPSVRSAALSAPLATWPVSTCTCNMQPH
jgi:hypothetical protein